MLQNLEKKQIDLTKHISVGFSQSRRKEDYFEEVQKKLNQAESIKGRLNSLPFEEEDSLNMHFDLDDEVRERNSTFKRQSTLDKMFQKVSITSKREDVENSIRIKLDSLEAIFNEVINLPTNKFGFEKVA